MDSVQRAHKTWQDFPIMRVHLPDDASEHREASQFDDSSREMLGVLTDTRHFSQPCFYEKRNDGVGEVKDQYGVTIGFVEANNNERNFVSVRHGDQGVVVPEHAPWYSPMGNDTYPQHAHVFPQGKQLLMGSVLPFVELHHTVLHGHAQTLWGERPGSFFEGTMSKYFREFYTANQPKDGHSFLPCDRENFSFYFNNKNLHNFIKSTLVKHTMDPQSHAPYPRREDDRFLLRCCQALHVDPDALPSDADKAAQMLSNALKEKLRSGKPHPDLIHTNKKEFNNQLFLIGAVVCRYGLENTLAHLEEIEPQGERTTMLDRLMDKDKKMQGKGAKPLEIFEWQFNTYNNAETDFLEQRAYENGQMIADQHLQKPKDIPFVVTQCLNAMSQSPLEQCVLKEPSRGRWEKPAEFRENFPFLDRASQTPERGLSSAVAGQHVNARNPSPVRTVTR